MRQESEGGLAWQQAGAMAGAGTSGSAWPDSGVDAEQDDDLYEWSTPGEHPEERPGGDGMGPNAAVWDRVQFDRTIGGRDNGPTGDFADSARKKQKARGNVAEMSRSGAGAGTQRAAAEHVVGDHRPPVLATGFDTRSMEEAFQRTASAIDKGDKSMAEQLRGAA